MRAWHSSGAMARVATSPFVYQQKTAPLRSRHTDWYWLQLISAPFDRMIYGAMACVDEANVLTLAAGIDPAALLIVVEYAYSRMLDFTQDTVWGVLGACMYLELDGATDLCTHFLCAQLPHACQRARGRQGSGGLALREAGGGGAGVR